MKDLIKKLKGDKIEITKSMGEREAHTSKGINKYIDELIEWLKKRN